MRPAPLPAGGVALLAVLTALPLTARPAPAPEPPPRGEAPLRPAPASVSPKARPAPREARPAVPAAASPSDVLEGAPRPTAEPPPPPRPPVPSPPKRHDAEAPRPKETGWPSRIGPFGLVSKDGRNVLAVGFAGQLMLQMDDKDGGSGDGREQTLRPVLRRVRFTLGGTFATNALGYYVQLSTAPGSVELMDLWLQWAATPFLALRVGHQKVLFTRHRTGSFKDLTFVDWSIVSPAFGDERQLGLALHNLDGGPHWLKWAFGLFTGINQRASHALGIARTFRETVPNPSNLLDPGPVDGFHPELVARVGYVHRRMTLDTDTDWEGGPLRLYAGVGATWDLDADPVRDFGARLAAELLLKVRHLSFSANAYAAWARSLDGGRLDQRWAMWGLLAQWSFLVAKRYELSARYALVDRARSFLRTARDRADARIAAATDPDEQAALTDQYQLAGKVRREHEATLGFTVYLVGRSIKLQADLGWLGTEGLTETRDDVRLRLQLQLAF